LMQSDHIREVFRELSHEMTTSDQLDADAVNGQGLGRLLAWTNVVVPLMTPDSVPYRGLDGFVDEARQTFQVASISGLTPDDLYDAGLINTPAKLYGFTVNSNTSVEFTVAADAWSRGGALVAILFSFIAALGLTLGELCTHRLHRFTPGVASVLALPVAKAAFFDANAVPLLFMMRGMVVYTLGMLVLVIIVEFACRTARKVRRLRPSAVSPLMRVTSLHLPPSVDS